MNTQTINNLPMVPMGAKVSRIVV